MLPQPGGGGCRVATQQFRDQRVKSRRMVHMDAVRDLMRDGGAADEDWRQISRQL